MASRAENKIRIHRPISPLPAPRAQAQQGWAPQAQTGVYLYNIQLIPEDLPTTKFAFTPLYSPQVPLAHTASQPNSHSLVLKITQDKTLSSQHANSILLTGDATGPLLEYHRQTNMTFTGAIIGLAVCVLPHHGSASDRSLEWFELIEEQNRGPLYIISSNPKGRDRIPAEYISLKTQTDHVGELS
ncbi:MAG: hypothetical protein LBF68_07705 [Christensenellaceae bacterium]|nr:hypothetical protein [Christensenellaceae bacterium]